MTRRYLRLGYRDDSGAALITVLLLLMALTAITTTVAVVTTNDTVSAGRDRQATGALATADAGVAAAFEYIRYNGVGGLNCLESDLAACSSNPAGWTNPTSPQQVRVDGGSGPCVGGSICYSVWIGTVTKYDPPAVKTGRYRVHSTGYSGGGPGAKAVVVDVAATPAQFPIGVFGYQLTGNGGTLLSHEMLFTQDCVSPRYDGSGNGTRFTGVDPYWGEPASANSTTYVSTDNNCGSGGRLHQSNPCPGNAAVNYDRSSLGAAITPSSGCANYGGSPISPQRTTTEFTLQMLQEQYGYRPGGLSDAEYEALRVRAVALGTYNVAPSTLVTKINDAVAAGVSHPVVYWDNGNVSLKESDIPTTFARTPGSACTAPYSVTIIVRNGDLVYQGGNSTWRSLAVFVPEGNFRGNGGYNVLGTLFAQDLSLGGNEQWRLDDCFVDNMPGPLMNLEALTFMEDDRNDIG